MFFFFFFSQNATPTINKRLLYNCMFLLLEGCRRSLKVLQLSFLEREIFNIWLFWKLPSISLSVWRESATIFEASSFILLDHTCCLSDCCYCPKTSPCSRLPCTRMSLVPLYHKISLNLQRFKGAPLKHFCYQITISK